MFIWVIHMFLVLGLLDFAWCMSIQLFWLCYFFLANTQKHTRVRKHAAPAHSCTTYSQRSMHSTSNSRPRLRHTQHNHKTHFTKRLQRRLRKRNSCYPSESVYRLERLLWPLEILWLLGSSYIVLEIDDACPFTRLRL